LRVILGISTVSCGAPGISPGALTPRSRPTIDNRRFAGAPPPTPPPLAAEGDRFCELLVLPART